MANERQTALPSKTIRNMAPFFRDANGAIHLREYSRRVGLSSAQSKVILESLVHDGQLYVARPNGIVWQQTGKKHFSAYKNRWFKKNIETYWDEEFEKVGLTPYLYSVFPKSMIFVYGDFAEMNVSPNSLLQIGIVGNYSATDVTPFEELLKRRIDVNPLYFQGLRTEGKRTWQL